MSGSNGVDVLTEPGPQWRDDDTERAIIGSALWQPDSADEISAWLVPEDFYREDHGKLWAAVLSLKAHGSMLDATALHREAMEAHGLSLDVTTAALERIVDLHGFHPALMAIHAQRLRALSVKRKLRAACLEAALLARDSTVDDVGEPLDLLDSRVFELRQALQQTGNGQAPETRQVLRGLFSTLEDRARGVSTRIPTGFSDLDRMTGGLARKRVAIVAGRPSMGKSAFVKDVACSAALSGLGVLVFTLEDSAEQWFFRALSGLAGVPLGRMLSPDFGDEDADQVMTWADRLVASNLLVDETAAVTPEQIRARVRLRQRKHPVDLVVVDYLQLAKPPAGRRYQSREQEVAATSAALVGVAKECDVALVVASQLNRKCEERSDRRPVKSDLRESGSLEQDAYQILMLHRACVYDDKAPEAEAEVIVAKNKDGRCGKVELRFDGPCLRFQSVAPEWRR